MLLSGGQWRHSRVDQRSSIKSTVISDRNVVHSVTKLHADRGRLLVKLLHPCLITEISEKGKTGLVSFHSSVDIFD